MWIPAAVAVLVITAYCVWQNNGIVVSKIEYRNGRIPPSFDGFVIVQVSDLHNKRYGAGSRRLLSRIAGVSPDIIVITGDLIDRRRYRPDIAMTFIDGALRIAPVYFVPGNHEAWSGGYPDLEEKLTKHGVTVLSNACAEILKGSARIRLAGLADPGFYTARRIKKANTGPAERFLGSLPDDGTFLAVLSHRPELFDLYARSGLELVFCGHAHGGQVRLPFVGGLYVPNQGLFPKYSEGVCRKGTSTMIVSRGLGNSLFPIRFRNRPELVTVTLVSAAPSARDVDIIMKNR